jgi:hypothetical protein
MSLWRRRTRKWWVAERATTALAMLLSRYEAEILEAGVTDLVHLYVLNGLQSLLYGC